MSDNFFNIFNIFTVLSYEAVIISPLLNNFMQLIPEFELLFIIFCISCILFLLKSLSNKSSPE